MSHMEVKAKARFIRMSPKKVRLVADLVRGLDVDKAEAQLTFTRKAATRPVLKVIRSARANAEHNHKISPETLFIKAIMVDGGPVLSRWTPRAFGRATPIRKRTSHITVVLDERTKEGAPEAVKKAVVKVAGKRGSGEAGKPAAVPSVKATEDKKKAAARKPSVKKPDVKKKESAS